MGRCWTSLGILDSVVSPLIHWGGTYDLTFFVVVGCLGGGFQAVLRCPGCAQRDAMSRVKCHCLGIEVSTVPRTTARNAQPCCANIESDEAFEAYTGTL